MTLMHRTLAMGLALVAAACGDAEPVSAVRVSGHVEATQVRLAPDAGGRVLVLSASEGDRVQPGDPIVQLDATHLELALDRARAERSRAEAQVRLLLAGARPEEIRQAEAQAASARADVAAAEAELASAGQDFDRFEALLQRHAGSRKQRDDAATRRDVARERVAAAQARVRAADEGIARLRSGARSQEVEAARAQVAVTDAQIASLEQSRADTILTSPIGGVVTERLVEVGEVIAPRTPVVVIVDLDHTWADVFVPEPVVPRLRLGQPATLFTDAGGDGFPGVLTWISPTAEFTPRNVQTADERSTLVYRVRVTVENSAGVLKVGMPVEATLDLQEP